MLLQTLIDAEILFGQILALVWSIVYIARGVPVLYREIRAIRYNGAT